MPKEVREEIGKLRELGWTLDEIMEQLRCLYDKAPSRSALHRHVQGLEKIMEKTRRSRQVAEALSRSLGDAPESAAARVNIEFLHGAIQDLFMRAADGELVDKHGQAMLNGNPEGTMMLAKALDHLARASKTNIDFIQAAEARSANLARKEAATAVDVVAREKGLTKDTVAAIKAGIFGVKPT
jgi:hypothetical protein